METKQQASSLRTGWTRLEKLIDAIFKVLFSPEADVHRGDFTFAIDQKCSGQRIDAAVFLGRCVVTDHYAVIDAQVLQERAHNVPTFVVHRDSENLKTFVSILALQFHEPGNFHAARAAPSSPEIEQNHLALIVREVDGLAFGILESKVRRIVTLAAGFNGSGANLAGLVGAALKQETDYGRGTHSDTEAG